MTEKLKKLVPPGTDVKKILNDALWMMGLLVLICLLFFGSYSAALSRLYVNQFGKRVMREGAMMPPFGALMHHKLAGLLMFCSWAFFLAVKNYMSYYSETRSIYVMKRLKSPAVLHRQCLALPLLLTLAAILAAAFLTGLFALCYRCFTPKQCIDPSPYFNLWRCLL